MTYQLERDMIKNPSNEPQPQPEPMPRYMLWLLVLASVAVVLMCGLGGYNDTMDKAAPVFTWATPEDLLNATIKTKE